MYPNRNYKMVWKRNIMLPFSKSVQLTDNEQEFLQWYRALPLETKLLIVHQLRNGNDRLIRTLISLRTVIANQSQQVFGLTVPVIVKN